MRRPWLRRTAGAVTGLLLLAATGLVAANWDDLVSFVPMPASVYATFLADALFVEGRTEEQARNWARLSLPVGKVTVDPVRKTVTVEAYFQTATARWVDERRGVVLE